MDFKKLTPVVVRHFHYDLNEENQIKNEVNVSFREVVESDEQGNPKAADENGKYFEIAVPFEVAPHPGIFTVSGLMTQVVQLEGYFGDGSDLEPSDYEILSRPLVEEIETLTYEITQVTLDQPVNLNFHSNFDDIKKNQEDEKN